LTLAIVVATYAAVAVGDVPFVRVGRTGAAVAGALLLVLTGAIGPRDALHAIDLRTILLLFAMMAVVAPLQATGVFARLMTALSRRVHHPAALVGAVVVASGSLSALFLNDTICVAFTPLILELAAIRRHRPLPYLLALATSSNIGSVATIVGNPQNILIGSVSGISPLRFSAVLAPVAAVGLAIDGLLIWLMFRDELAVRAADEEPLVTPAFPQTARARLDVAMRAIDWRLLLLFAGLFVVVGAVEQAGIDRRLFSLLQPLGVDTPAGLSATAAVLSNAVSNVPAVMLFTRVVPKLADPSRAWLTLAMATTLAGNLTILGSIANLIVVEGAKRQGVTVRFADYFRVGFPVTILTLAFGVWWTRAM
jgi:Na+/H+ antiporter NhaD/arsenite permease-like protein